MQAASFDRRIYTPATLERGLRDILDHVEDLHSAVRGRRVSRQFAEKIMLAVSRVLGCRYCLYGHSRAALVAGVTEEELRCLLSGQLENVPDEQVVALVFAQHMPNRWGRPIRQPGRKWWMCTACPCPRISWPISA